MKSSVVSKVTAKAKKSGFVSSAVSKTVAKLKKSGFISSAGKSACGMCNGCSSD